MYYDEMEGDWVGEETLIVKSCEQVCRHLVKVEVRLVGK
jgi:hypothetical protein